MSYLEIIVDGYNFLKTTGLLDTNVSDSELEKGRRRLFRLLVQTFPDPEDRKVITIVFDSATLLKLPKKQTVQGLNVYFSKGYDSADEMIIEMIRNSPVPKRLLVVSSDHEIQTAAQRRRAKFMDSDRWLDDLEAILQKNRDIDSQTESSQTESSHTSEKPQHKDAEYWLEVFKDIEVPDESAAMTGIKPENKNDSSPENAKLDDSPGDKKKSSESLDDDLSDWKDIFPPGYGEDLLD